MQSELTRLQQAVDHNRSIYNTFLGSQTSTQIRESVMNTELGASVVIVEAAARPIDPVEPDPMKIMILALVFGLTMGGSGLLLNEFSDSSFRSVEEVERELGLKVLGTVPRFEHETRWYEDKSRKRIVLWAATSVVIVAVALSGFYFYGQSMRNQMIDLKLSRTTSQQ